MIRPAKPEDAPCIASLWNWMINKTLATFTTLEKSPDEILAFIETRPDCFFVAEDGTALTGFATCGSFRAGPGYAATRELSVVVSPDAHGQGIGCAMLTQLENGARMHGAHVMVAGISGANPAAIAFHEALGYRETGRMVQVGRKSGQWLDLVLMQKILDPSA